MHHVSRVLRLGLVITRVFVLHFLPTPVGSLPWCWTNPRFVFYFVEVCPKVLGCRFPGNLTLWNQANG